MKLFKIILFTLLICTLSFAILSCSRECVHEFEKGECTKCGERDPDYIEPVHIMEFGTFASDGTLFLTEYRSNQDNNVVRIPATYEGKTVTAIDKYVFSEQGKEAFYIPATITKIDTSAFEYSYSSGEDLIPVNIYYDGTLEDWMNIEFVNRFSNPMSMGATHFYIKDGDGYTEITKLNIPEGTTSIKNCTFYNFSFVTEISLPEGLTSIGHYSLTGTSITSLTLPSTLKYMGEWALAYTKLTSITIPSSVMYIGTQVFLGCHETLATINFESTQEWYDVTVINTYADEHTFEAIQNNKYRTLKTPTEFFEENGTPNYYDLFTRPKEHNFFGYYKGTN